mgnify:CR=1 FL=1
MGGQGLSFAYVIFGVLSVDLFKEGALKPGSEIETLIHVSSKPVKPHPCFGTNGSTGQ